VRVEFEEFGVRYRIPVPGSDGLNGVEELCWCIRHSVRLDINLWYMPDAGNNPSVLGIVDDLDDRCSKMSEISENLFLEALSRYPMAGIPIVKATLDEVRSSNPALVRNPGPEGGFSTGISDSVTVREAQRILGYLGFEPGPADGVAGRRTSEAVKSFQAAIGIAPGGNLDRSTGALLRNSVFMASAQQEEL
jgi:hypothetical protein